MTIQQAYQQLLVQLYKIYDDREANNIAQMVVEHVTGFNKIDRILNKSFPLNADQEEYLKACTNKLLQHIPVQYVLQEAWFAGMKFYVDNNVLIPRPETEELVDWIVTEVKGHHLKIKSNTSVSNEPISILDIGTGSGCIPIALKKKLTEADVHAVDASEGALNVARRNATEQDVAIDFIHLDFLNEVEWNKLSSFDIIVSNPPYVKQSEEAHMQKNVLDNEPHLALFVPNEDPLLFYKKIALFAKKHLNENGMIFAEINEALGDEVKLLFEQWGYQSIEIKKDLQGKDRMVKISQQ